MIKRIALIASVLATHAHAEFTIQNGTYFVYVNDYDHETNSFSSKPPDGQKDACFKITQVNLADKMIDIELVSGTFTPWWAGGKVFKPGFVDSFVPPNAYMDNNPGADWTELFHKLLETVPTCPADDG